MEERGHTEGSVAHPVRASYPVPIGLVWLPGRGGGKGCQSGRAMGSTAGAKKRAA